MKKSFISLLFIGTMAVVLTVGCSKPVKTCTTYTEDNVLAGYSGSHSILNNTYSFDDSLTITNPTAGDAKISIKSEKLGTSLTGTFDANNCGRVTLDSVIIASQVIESVTLTNIRASGYGVFNGTTLKTVINIKSGSALIGSLPISLAGQSLTGTFTKK